MGTVYSVIRKRFFSRDFAFVPKQLPYSGGEGSGRGLLQSTVWHSTGDREEND